MELFGVVCKLHRTDGSSSVQAPAFRSSGLMRRFLMPAPIRPLAFSTCPFVCGCATEAYVMLIPRPSQKSWNSLEMKFDPLSVMMLCVTQNVYKMNTKYLLAVVFLWLVPGMASPVLVILSTATRR